MSNIKFSKRFLNSLSEISNNPDNCLREWRYAGGNKGSHEKYYKLRYKNCTKPSHQTHCICGSEIVENCYLENILDQRIIAVGNCCIKRYIPEELAGRTCLNCGNSHKNRKDSYCNDCRLCRISIGKYKGHYFWDVYDADKSYCKWALESNIDDKEFLAWLNNKNLDEQDDIMPFGKYRGKTFQFIYDNDKEYCKWCQENDTYDEFVEWLSNKPAILFDNIFTIGKYKGNSFSEVLTHDIEYAKWAMNNNAEFATWLNDNNIDPMQDYNATFTFGKYKGETFDEILQKDVEYCKWASENCDAFAKWLSDNNVNLAKLIETSDTFTFGKYNGKSFDDVLKIDLDYCKWAFMHCETFHQWAKTNNIDLYQVRINDDENTILNIGKHKGDSYIKILTTDLEYCKWILSEEKTGELGAFANWLKLQLSK
jgi:uncharacterized protein (DUF3820 family)